MSLEEAVKKAHPYLVEGIGEDILPETVDLNLVDDIVVVNDQEAFAMTRFLARKEGILVGGSSGVALYGTISRYNIPRHWKELLNKDIQR